MTLFAPAVLLSALVTLAAIILCIAIGIYVRRVREAVKIEPPAMTGDPRLERALRVQGNTIEAMTVFVPAFWLATIYFAGWITGAVGVVWLVGRILYWPSYMKNPNGRMPGFIIAMLSTVVLTILALIGVIRAIVATT